MCQFVLFLSAVLLLICLTAVSNYNNIVVVTVYNCLNHTRHEPHATLKKIYHQFICRNNITNEYIQSNNKQRQAAARKATRLNELAAEYNLNVAIIYKEQEGRR